MVFKSKSQQYLKLNCFKADMDKTKTMGQNISRHDNSCLCGVFNVQIGYQKGF